MEYKIFGPEPAPPEDFVKDLQAFCNLDDVQREALGSWFESTTDFNTYSPELPLQIRASTLLPDQFRQTASPIRLILGSWHSRSLDIADIERDLLLLGLEASQISAISAFLARLSHVRERVWTDDREGFTQLMGVPTLDDANIVWDARAIFGGSTYYYFSGDDDAGSYNRCLGLTNIAIVELMASDYSGNKQRIAVQMSEDAFRRFVRAVNRADDQLKSLKEFIKPTLSGVRDV